MRYKYPKTKHLPFSKGLTRGDKVIESLEQFIGKENNRDMLETLINDNGLEHLTRVVSFEDYKKWYINFSTIYSYFNIHFFCNYLQKNEFLIFYVDINGS